MSDNINARQARLEAKRRAEIDRRIMARAKHLTRPVDVKVHIVGGPTEEAMSALLKICHDNYPRGGKP